MTRFSPGVFEISLISAEAPKVASSHQPILSNFGRQACRLPDAAYAN